MNRKRPLLSIAMNDPTYDIIGKGYNQNRVADRRIVKTVIDLLSLPAGSLIADIGAGTGNYSDALAVSGYRILAVEPSEVMRRQATPHPEVTWIAGVAEALPLRDASVDAVIIILSTHHFADIHSAAGEAARICHDGPSVILTMDPRDSERFWFNDYFPGIAQHVRKSFPPLQEIINVFSLSTHRPAKVIRFPLPCDLADRNMCAGWNRPEIYLDPLMRQNTSGFALTSPAEVKKGIILLENDLRSGEWDEVNGCLRSRESFDAGFRFLLFSR